MLKKPRDDIDSVYYEDLDNYDGDDDDNNINYYDYVYRDLINKHITTMELNNNNNSDNNNNNNNNNDNNNNNNTDRGEWKIQLTMINSCTSTKSFKDKHNIYSESKPVEIYMGIAQKMLLKHFLIHFYKIFNVHKIYQMKEEANLIMIVLNY